MKFRLSLLSQSVSLACLTLSSMSFAGGFALAEQSVGLVGAANAGASALAMDDASTVFYNPAGMALLSKPQVTSGLHVISLKASFKNESSIGGVGQTPSTADTGSIGHPTPVPALYAAMPINNQFAVGLGISAPFGLKTEYNEGWIGRYQALVSEVKSLNVNPSISFKVNDQLALGFGVNYMKFQAELTNNVNYTAVALRGLQSQGLPAAQIAALTPALLGREGTAQIKGDDNQFGYNLGVMFSMDRDTRIGAAYRSGIKFDLSGNAAFNRPATSSLPAAIAGSVGIIQGVGTADGPVTVAVKTPATFAVSGVTRISPRMQVMGDITWTQWSNVPGLQILRNNGAILNGVVYDWKDTMRYSIGASYDYGAGIIARAGLAYDESPVSDAHRTARLPDANRLWLSLGGSYQWSKNIRLDAGFTHIFIQRGKIQDDQRATGAGLIHGFYEGSVNILSIGGTMSF